MDVMSGAVGRVDMVVSNGGGGYELDAASIEQVGIAAGAGAYDECIGIVHKGSINVCARRIYGIYTHCLQGFADVGNLIVYNYFHLIPICFRDPC